MMRRRHHTPHDLAHGGHVFVPVRPATWYRGAPLYRCVRCHGVLPGWAIPAAGWLHALLGTAHCRELVPALNAPAAAATVAGDGGHVPGPVLPPGPGTPNRTGAWSS